MKKRTDKGRYGFWLKCLKAHATTENGLVTMKPSKYEKQMQRNRVV